MKFWYFKFEGWFSDDEPDNPGMGFYTDCLIAAENEAEARFNFSQALVQRKLNLIEIEEDFPVDTDPEMMDPKNPENEYWFEWCSEVELKQEASFREFYIYPSREVVKPTIEIGDQN